MPAAAHALTRLTQTSMPTPHAIHVAHCQPPPAIHVAHCQPTQVRLTVGKCLDHDSMTNEVSRCSQPYSAPLRTASRRLCALLKMPGPLGYPVPWQGSHVAWLMHHARVWPWQPCWLASW